MIAFASPRVLEVDQRGTLARADLASPFRANGGDGEHRRYARGIARAGLSAAGCGDWALFSPVLQWIGVSRSKRYGTPAAGLFLTRSKLQAATRRHALVRGGRRHVPWIYAAV